MIFFYGTNIRQNPSETLIPIDFGSLKPLITNSSNKLALETARIRKIAEIDNKVYKTVKLSLPYLIGAEFENGQRHSDNFLYINAIVVDFDDCLKTPGQSKDLKNLIKEQMDVWFFYVSPSQNGLKIWFKLESPIEDLIVFKKFYLDFARIFAERIHLLGTLDTRTCDATRVCFLAHDPDAYFNDNPEELQWELWHSKNAMLEIENPIKETELSIKQPINVDVHQRINQIINPSGPIRPKIDPFVPEIIKKIEKDIVCLLSTNEIQVEMVIPIPFGLKFCARQHLQKAEVSIFYGKKGFSVVKTPKTNVSIQLNETVQAIIYEFLFNSSYAT